MALRASSYWRSVVARQGCSSRTFATSATNAAKSAIKINVDHAPIYMVCGMVVVALSIAVHTAKQQLVHSPSVNVNKKRRESVAEVDDPHQASTSGQKFLDKSFLRKIAHIQEDPRTLPDPMKNGAEPTLAKPSER